MNYTEWIEQAGARFEQRLRMDHETCLLLARYCHDRHAEINEDQPVQAVDADIQAFDLRPLPLRNQR